MKKQLSLLIAIVIVMLINVPIVGCIGSHCPHTTIISRKDKCKGYLGVNIEDVTKRIIKRNNLAVDRGAYVSDVVEDSPAEDAGIESGDVIVKFDGENIHDSGELTDAIRETKPKSKVDIELYRGSGKKTLTVRIGKVEVPRVEFYNLGHAIRIPRIHIPIPPKPPRPHISVMTIEDEFDGLQFQELTEQLGEYFGVKNGKGVLITQVERESESGKAGFKAGDVITKIDNNYSIENINDLRRALNHSEGKNVLFEIMRSGKTTAITMKIVHDEDSDWDEDDDE